MSSIVSSSSLGAHAAVPRCSCCLLLALPWRRPEVSRLPSSAHRASSITPPSIPASTWMPASPSSSSSRCCSPGRPHLEPPPPTSCANLHPRLAGLRMPMSAGPAPTSARACAGQRPPLRRWCCPMSANAHCCWPQRRPRPALPLRRPLLAPTLAFAWRSGVQASTLASAPRPPSPSSLPAGCVFAPSAFHERWQRDGEKWVEMVPSFWRNEMNPLLRRIFSSRDEPNPPVFQPNISKTRSDPSQPT